MENPLAVLACGMTLIAALVVTGCGEMESLPPEKTDQVMVIVDNETARENVQRMAQSKGFDVSVDEKTDGIYLYVSGDGEPSIETALAEVTAAAPVAGPTILLIPSNVPRTPSYLLTLVPLHPCSSVVPPPHRPVVPLPLAPPSDPRSTRSRRTLPVPRQRGGRGRRA